MVVPINVILASSSPRRYELLNDAGVRFRVQTPSVPVDESLEPDELAAPEEAVKKLAERKAGAVVQDILAVNPVGLGIVIGADTMVVLDGSVYGKPFSADDARRMLRELSGRTHEVLTGVSVWLVLLGEGDQGNVSLAYRSFVEKSQVTFKELADEQIDAYVATGETIDKAGAYAIQGKGAELVAGYEGDYDNIVGLPVTRLLNEFPDLLRTEAEVVVRSN